MDYYDNIEIMPIYNYNKVQETGDLKYIGKGEGKIDEEKAKEHWDNVRQQVIDRYGLDFELMDYYESLKKLVKLKADMLVTGERFLINEIRILEAQIKDFESGGGVSNFDKVYLSISKYLGYRFNPRKESVVNYKECLSMMEEEQSARNNKKD